MSSFCPVYVPVGVPTFHLESAQAEFEKSCALLRKLDGRFVCPEEMLLGLDKLRAYLEPLHPDLLVFQNLTFANAAYMAEVLRRFDCPVLLWTLREPCIDGGRLRLNSLTGAYSAANTLRAFSDRPFAYVFGAPGEDRTREEIGAVLRAAALKHALRSLKLAAVGHTPQGFGFGRALDAELMDVFGVELEAIEVRELLETARGYTDAACEADVYGALSMWMGMQLSGEPVFFGDPVSLDEGENTITFWHCGAAACSLARKDTGAVVGVHPNRKIGPAMDFGCEAFPEATVFRVGREPDGSFRFFLCEGRVLDKPKQFTGTSLVVQTDEESRAIVESSVKAGFEPHFVVMKGRHAAALAALGEMYGFPVYWYK